jgi:hypothetical protein
MKPERNRLFELACNTGCFLLALKRGQFGKLRFFAHHAIRAIV